jgi:2-(1,2-epoxy-1,2-dihydrophenyl)acetyl-CoA isomerase
MSAVTECLSISLNRGVAVLEMDRPPHNYFDLELITRIARSVTELNEIDACRAMVLTSRGKTFCAGADFRSGVQVDAGAVYGAALPIFRRTKPLIAAVQGAAIGGGLGLAVAADFRVVAPEARFQANFVRIGLHPGFGLTHTLPRLLGARIASDLLLTGRRVDGREAVELGLADRLAETLELKNAAVSFAETIAEGAPLAIKSIQGALIAGLADEVEKAMARELVEQRRLFATEDFREGVLATRDKRPPQFKGC